MFCLKCYPGLYNGAFGDIVHRGKPNKSDMNELSTLIYRPDIYSCDPDLFDENDLKNKVKIYIWNNWSIDLSSIEACDLTIIIFFIYFSTHYLVSTMTQQEKIVRFPEEHTMFR